MNDEERRQKLELLKKSGLEPIHMAYTFDNFEVTGLTNNNLAACRAFVETPLNLYIYGPAGNGKTRLAVTAIKDRLLKYPDEYGRVIFWEDFKNAVMADMRNDSTEYIDMLARRKCLLIDDIFRNGVNETTKAAIIRLFEKWGNHEKKKLIVTSNKDIEQLSKILEDDRAVSRTVGLFDMIVENSGQDYPVRNLKEKVLKAGQDFNARAVSLGVLK